MGCTWIDYRYIDIHQISSNIKQYPIYDTSIYTYNLQYPMKIWICPGWNFLPESWPRETPGSHWASAPTSASKPSGKRRRTPLGAHRPGGSKKASRRKYGRVGFHWISIWKKTTIQRSSNIHSTGHESGSTSFWSQDPKKRPPWLSPPSQGLFQESESAKGKLRQRQAQGNEANPHNNQEGRQIETTTWRGPGRTW